jgi:hypothetical protein
MRHDPKMLAARHAEHQAKIAAATADIDAQIKALEQRKLVAIRAINAEHRTFPDGLIYSATARCKCGAGLCYEEGKTGINGAWTCSVCVLADRANLPMEGWDKTAHQAFPFREYEIKSEDQPSAFGATTRPDPQEASS